MAKRHLAPSRKRTQPMEQYVRRNLYKNRLRKTAQSQMEASKHELTVSVRHLLEKTAERELEEAARDVLQTIRNGDAGSLSCGVLKALESVAKNQKRSMKRKEDRIYREVVEAHVKQNCALTRFNPRSLKDPERNAFFVVARKNKLTPDTVETYYRNARPRHLLDANLA